MKSLTQIVKSLKPSEVRLIRKLYSTQPNGEEKKRLKLFEIILSGTDTDLKAAKILYNTTPNSAFSHIKARLKTDILSYLTVHDASKKRDINKISQIKMSCKRLVAQGEIVLVRGLYEEAEKLLIKALNMAIEYEFYIEIIRIKTLLRMSIGYRRGIKEYEKYSSNLDYYIQELYNFTKVEEYYAKIMLPNHFNTNKHKEILEFSIKCCEELDNLYNEESSSNFTFHYYQFKVNHFNLLENFNKSLEYAEKLVALVPSKSALNSKTNIAGTHLVLSKAYLNAGHYDKAIESAKISISNFRKGMINNLRAMEALFFGYLRNKDYDMAEEIINDALLHKQIKSNPLLKAKWIYFESNIAYLKNDRDRSFKLLRKNNDLTKDKSGWLIGFKLLEMMLTIEEKDWYWLSFQLNNFNQLLGRHQKANINRAKIIGQIIRSLLTNGGNFDTTIGKSSVRLQLLVEGKGDFYWNPTSYEILRFDKWIKSKARKRSTANS